MSDGKVIPFNKKKPGAIEDQLIEIAKLIAGDDDNSESDLHAKNDKSISYDNSSNNIIGNNNFVNHGVLHVNSTVKKRVQVKTGDGVINAEQKHKIKALLYEWVESHNSIKKAQLTHQTAWIKLNNSLKVNSYHEINSADFSKAIKFLRSKIGALRNMASAPKKVDDWRSQTIKSIQARCSERGWQEWRKAYMKKTLNKSSMTELTDTELQKLYQTIWNKK